MSEKAKKVGDIAAEVDDAYRRNRLGINFVPSKDGDVSQEPYSSWLEHRDLLLEFYDDEAQRRNYERPFRERFLGRNTLTAIDIAHEKALVENRLYYGKEYRKFEDHIERVFSEEDQEQIYDALDFTVNLHKDQADRPDGQPYFNHPIRVAEAVLEINPNFSKDMIIAALLHDSVEDQAGTLSQLLDKDDSRSEKARALEYLRQRYGRKVATMVGKLSNPDYTALLAKKGISEADPGYGEIKNQLYADHIRQAIEDPEILILKMSDFSDNALKLSDLPEESPEQIAQKQELTKKYFSVMKIFLDRLERDNLYPQYQQLLKAALARYTQ